MPDRIRLSEFVVWSEYRSHHYYFSWALMLLGYWSIPIGRHLYMGLIFTALFAIGLIANFAKISIYGTSLGGDDLNNLGSLQILVGDHGLWVGLGSLLLLALLWHLRWFGWLLRFVAVLVTFFGFSVRHPGQQYGARTQHQLFQQRGQLPPRDGASRPFALPV